MVKIEEHDAGSDDDCYEISLEEFAKKVSLKEDDDVILVASKGKIVKVEEDHPEDSAKAYDDYDAEAECLCIRGSGCGRGQQAAAVGGDCVDKPYKIDDDEAGLLKVEDMFVIGKPSGGGYKNGRSCNAANVIPGVLVVPVVKSEPVGDNGVEAAEEASYDHCLEMAHEKRIFDEEDEEDVVNSLRSLAPEIFMSSCKTQADQHYCVFRTKHDAPNVALRDFPHPRHLCGNFPFNTTHHESHCSKCYCSLCDVPASNCLNWEGTGGHCHTAHTNT